MKDQAYKTTFESLSDMQEYIGKELGLTDWVVIDQDTINAFANLPVMNNGYMWIRKRRLNIPLTKKQWPMVF
jgi:hypothetical protein